ncbi:hypothetical protein P7C70_g8109, partial [Phenoliferia sp. Uapishka_3]
MGTNTQTIFVRNSTYLGITVETYSSGDLFNFGNPSAPRVSIRRQPGSAFNHEKYIRQRAHLRGTSERTWGSPTFVGLNFTSADFDGGGQQIQSDSDRYITFIDEYVKNVREARYKKIDLVYSSDDQSKNHTSNDTWDSTAFGAVPALIPAHARTPTDMPPNLMDLVKWEEDQPLAEARTTGAFGSGPELFTAGSHWTHKAIAWAYYVALPTFGWANSLSWEEAITPPAHTQAIPLQIWVRMPVLADPHGLFDPATTAARLSTIKVRADDSQTALEVYAWIRGEDDSRSVRRFVGEFGYGDLFQPTRSADDVKNRNGNPFTFLDTGESPVGQDQEVRAADIGQRMKEQSRSAELEAVPFELRAPEAVSG